MSTKAELEAEVATLRVQVADLENALGGGSARIVSMPAEAYLRMERARLGDLIRDRVARGATAFLVREPVAAAPAVEDVDLLEV